MAMSGEFVDVSVEVIEIICNGSMDDLEHIIRLGIEESVQDDNKWYDLTRESDIILLFKIYRRHGIGAVGMII